MCLTLNLLAPLQAALGELTVLSLLRLYRTLIRSIWIGCIVYGSASPSTLRPLNTIHNAGIELVQAPTARVASMPWPKLENHL